jgi:hypothetical protein
MTFNSRGYRSNPSSLVLIALSVTTIGLSLSTIVYAENKQTKLVGNIDYLAAALHGAGIQIDSLQLPATIKTIRIGSPAQSGGLLKNDKITKITLAGSTIVVQLKRGVKEYQQTLMFQQPVPDSAQQPKSGTAQSTKITQGVTEQDWEKSFLQRFDFVILQDCSKSMLSDLRTEAGTRWSWCSRNLSTFADNLQRVASSKPFVVFFNDNADELGYCTSALIQNKFNQILPSGATDIGSPLEKQLKATGYGRREKQQLIVIISDGISNRGINVTEALSNYAASQRKVNLRVIFFIINDEHDFNEDRILAEQFQLSPRLREFVSVINFADVRSFGFMKAIANAVK